MSAINTFRCILRPINSNTNNITNKICIATRSFQTAAANVNNNNFNANPFNFLTHANNALNTNNNIKPDTANDQSNQILSSFALTPNTINNNHSISLIPALNQIPHIQPFNITIINNYIQINDNNVIPTPVNIDIDNNNVNNNEDNKIECVVERPYRPKVQRRKRKHGFLHRLHSATGRRVLKRRRAKGRHRLSA